jgi:glutaryl-CoA dehydrogenase
LHRQNERDRRLGRGTTRANGILLDHQIGRFATDSGALYSCEGTREMNALVVGKAIAGFSAFV